MAPGELEPAIRPPKEHPLHSLSKTNPKLNRLAGIALVLAALVVGVLLRRPSAFQEPVLEPGIGSSGYQARPESQALPDLAMENLAVEQELHRAPAQEPSEEAAVRKRRDDFTYGVKGMVTHSPLAETALELAQDGTLRPTTPRGTIRAVDSAGVAILDRFGNGGYYQMFGLSPGWWFIEIDADRHGRASSNVLITEEAPLARLDFELVLPPHLTVHVALASDESGHEQDKRNLYLAAHPTEAVGPKTSWDSLELLASGAGRLSWEGGKRSLSTSIQMDLPNDGPTSLSLFFEDRWIASRVKAAGEMSIDWELSQEEWSVKLGRLEVQLVDASNGKALDYHIQTPQWDAKRASTEAVGTTTFLDVPPGWRTLFIEGGQHESGQHKVFVGSGADVKKTISLNRGVRISGSVIRSDGEPQQTHIGAWLVDQESGELTKSPTATSWTSHHGEFHFSGMPPGTYFIRNLRTGEHGIRTGKPFPRFGTGLVRVEARADQTGVVIELSRLGDLVLELSQEPQGFVPWKVFDEFGSIMWQGQFRSAAPTRLCLPLGTYRLETEGLAGVRSSRTINIGAGKQRIVL